MNFRTAQYPDLPQLLLLEQRVIEAERPFNASIKAGEIRYYDIEKLISESDSCLIVAEDAGEIVGTGYAQIRTSKNTLEHEHHSYLGFMYVSSQHRRQGINKRILNRLIDWSHKQGVQDIYLEVYAKNSAAVRAYEKAAFEACVVEMKLKM